MINYNHMFIKFFKDLSKKDVAEAGGKGASLGEMTKAGIPVPPGFVILASAFNRFLEETDLSQEVQAWLMRLTTRTLIRWTALRLKFGI